MQENDMKKRIQENKEEFKNEFLKSFEELEGKSLEELMFIDAETDAELLALSEPQDRQEADMLWKDFQKRINPPQKKGFPRLSKSQVIPGIVVTLAASCLVMFSQMNQLNPTSDTDPMLSMREKGNLTKDESCSVIFKNQSGEAFSTKIPGNTPLFLFGKCETQGYIHLVWKSPKGTEITKNIALSSINLSLLKDKEQVPVAFQFDKSKEPNVSLTIIFTKKETAASRMQKEAKFISEIGSSSIEWIRKVDIEVQ